MSASEDQEPAPDEPERGEPGPEPSSDPRQQADSPPRLRRRLLGASPADVRAALAEREGEITELRRDVTALWLAFGQHERTIQQLLAALERLAGIEIPSPGGRAQPVPESAPSPQVPPRAEPAPEPPGRGEAPAPRAGAPLSASISEQLSDLDQVLAAIEQATHSLERAYEDELTAPESTSDEVGPDEGEDH